MWSEELCAKFTLPFKLLPQPTNFGYLCIIYLITTGSHHYCTEMYVNINLITKLNVQEL